MPHLSTSPIKRCARLGRSRSCGGTRRQADCHMLSPAETVKTEGAIREAMSRLKGGAG